MIQRIGIVSSINYFKKSKIQSFIKKIYDTYGTYPAILSGGNTEGSDMAIKKSALDFNFNYVEYNPSYTGYGMYSAMPSDYYGKPYHYSHPMHRYKELVNNSQKLIVFIDSKEGIETPLQYMITYAQKRKKDIVLID